MQSPLEHNDPGTIPEPTGIVSVNSRGGAASGMAGKVIFFLAVFGLLIVGLLYGVNKYRANKKTTEAAAQASTAAENKPAAVAARRTFDTDPPPLPSGAPAPAAGTAGGTAGSTCPDHSASQLLLGPDGKPMSAPTGLPIRVCANGQVVVPAVQPLPGVVPGAAGATAVDGTPRLPAGGVPVTPPRRFGGDVLLPAQSAAPQIDPNNPLVQALLGRMAPDAIGGERTTGGAGAATPPPMPLPPALVRTGSASTGGSVAAAVQGGDAGAVSATRLGNRDMILPQGRSIDCNLSMRLINEVSGKATCVLSSNVYSDNGRVVLAERGSVAVGDYIALAAQGQRRLFVLWTRLETPTGVVIAVSSPAADALGTTGLGGYVDNRWGDRIGAAVLLSLVEDAIGYQTAKASSANGATGAQGIAVFQSTTQTGHSMAERILDSTINIKPTIYKNQGDRATIFVSRDLDFGSVYVLRAK